MVLMKEVLPLCVKVIFELAYFSNHHARKADSKLALLSQEVNKFTCFCNNKVCLAGQLQHNGRFGKQPSRHDAIGIRFTKLGQEAIRLLDAYAHVNLW